MLKINLIFRNSLEDRGAYVTQINAEALRASISYAAIYVANSGITRRLSCIRCCRLARRRPRHQAAECDSFNSHATVSILKNHSLCSQTIKSDHENNTTHWFTKTPIAFLKLSCFKEESSIPITPNYAKNKVLSLTSKRTRTRRSTLAWHIRFVLHHRTFARVSVPVEAARSP